MEFKKYQHIERFGTTEVAQIELGNATYSQKLTEQMQVSGLIKAKYKQEVEKYI